MIDPPINKLMTKVDSRYTLVIMAAKRAREIADLQREDQFVKRVSCKSNKPVTIATNEIVEEKIRYCRSDNLVKKMAGEIPEVTISDMNLHEVDLYEEE